MRKLVTLGGITLLFLSITMLFYIKYEVRDLKQALIDVENQIRNEYVMMHVLEAEWSYLNNPARLAQLSQTHLALQAPKSHQMKMISPESPFYVVQHTSKKFAQR